MAIDILLGLSDWFKAWLQQSQKRILKPYPEEAQAPDVLSKWQQHAIQKPGIAGLENTMAACKDLDVMN
jgi:hypothetical protein